MPPAPDEAGVTEDPARLLALKLRPEAPPPPPEVPLPVPEAAPGVVARDALLLAGGKSLAESSENHGPGTFWVASREDGSKRSTCMLPAPPVPCSCMLLLLLEMLVSGLLEFCPSTGESEDEGGGTSRPPPGSCQGEREKKSVHV